MKPQISRNAKLFVHLVVVPLLLISAAWWLMQHAQSKLDELPTDAQVQTEIQRLKGLRADVESGKIKQLRFDGDTMIYAGAAATQKLDRRIRTIESSFGGKLTAYSRAQPFAKASIAASLAGIVVGLSGVLMALGAGRAALRSREALASVFDRTRRAMPWLMALQILLMAVAIFLLTVVIGWYAYETFTAPRTDRGMAKLEIGGIVLGLGATWVGLRGIFGMRRAFDAFEPTPMSQWGREVSEAQAPGLWAHVRGIAARLDARAPHHVVVGLTDGFYVTAHDVELLPEAKVLKGETLYLPLSYAALMRPEELDGIVGHELGHFSGDDTQYSLRFVPLHAGMARSMVALELSHEQGSGNWMLAPAALLGDFLMERVQRAVAHWSRLREFAADQVGVRVSGAPANASALIRGSAIAPVIGTYLDETFRRPEDAPPDILQGLLDYARKTGFQLPDLNAELAITHPTDTHPATADRVKALGVVVDETLIAHACAPAGDEGLRFLDTLLPDRVQLQHQLSADVSVASLENKQAVKAELQAVIEGVSQPLALRERVRTSQWISWAMVIIALAGGGVLLMMMLKHGGPSLALGLGLGLAAVVGAAFASLALWWGRRGKTPVGTLTPTGLASDSLRAELPWAAMEEMHATIVNGSTTQVTFTLGPEAAPPQLINSNLRRFKWKPKKRAFILSMGRVNNTKPQELLDLINDYRRADHARNILADMDAPSQVKA